MKLIEDNLTGQIETYNPDWNNIEEAINQINSDNKCYIILERGQNNYLQCAGDQYRLTVEIRESNDFSFKHFVIGLNPPMKKIIWTTINCRVGPIYVHENEILTLENIHELLKAYFNKENIGSTYYKRNITKQFAERLNT